MARLAGVDLPDNKRVVIALTYIFGIGFSRSKELLGSVGVEMDKKVRDLTDEEITKIRSYIDDNFPVEGELRAEVTNDIKRLRSIGCYRGIRHRKGLPVRGQRTKTNARTRKGPKRTVGRKKKSD